MPVKRKDIIAKVLNPGIIEHGPNAAKTTFTENGEKPWAIDNRYKGDLNDN